MRFSIRVPVAASLIVMGLLAGCSKADIPTRTDSTAAPTQDTCGSAAGTIEQHLKMSEVDKVMVQGQCTSVVIATTLTDDATENARKLCEIAAEVAYTGDINSVAVLGKSGRELAIGISGMKCLASQ